MAKPEDDKHSRVVEVLAHVLDTAHKERAVTVAEARIREARDNQHVVKTWSDVIDRLRLVQWKYHLRNGG